MVLLNGFDAGPLLTLCRPLKGLPIDSPLEGCLLDSAPGSAPVSEVT